MLQLVAFDVAGTTVSDDGLVLDAFASAFAKVVPERWRLESATFTKYAVDTMGRSKIEVFTELLNDVSLAELANVEFEKAYRNLIVDGGLKPIGNAGELFVNLHDRGIKVGLTTGFSRETLDLILGLLNWNNLIDASCVPAEVGAGRPSPLMLHRLASTLGVLPENTVVLGDSQSDMRAAVAFGAAEAIGVLSGIHDREALVSAGATAVIDSVSSLEGHLFSHS